MATWTHVICEDCWRSRYPEREATRLRDADRETCCFCGTDTFDGIYLRRDPAEMRCVHDEEQA